MGNTTLVFGPAYVDVVVEVDGTLLPPPRRLDQSLPAIRRIPRADGRLEILGPTGDCLTLMLPPDAAGCAATYELAEPVLARHDGPETEPLRADYLVRAVTRELGGMGAGYAKALEGDLRMPLGATDGQPDGVGEEALSLLARHDITCHPAWVPGVESDTSLLLQTGGGDKLAIGVRRAMPAWTVTAEDHALAAGAEALVFCGAPNALAAAVLTQAPPRPVLCAPALRNVTDTAVPLAALAEYVHVLTLNALEWDHLDDREALRRHVPLIAVTDGPRGSRLLLGETDILIPTALMDGPVDVNRAGETFGATLFQALRAWCPDFPRGLTPELADRAGRLAARQAARQLTLRGFAFPPADWR